MAHEQLIPGSSVMNNERAIQAPAPPPPPLREKRIFFPLPVAWFVLVISLAATAGGCFIVWQHAELAARKRFDEEIGRITAALGERMQIYEDVLHGAAGLYAASYTVERGEFRTYLESVSIERRFPGIDGVGFIAHVPREQLDSFLEQVRADKAPDFQVKEPGTNNDLQIIKFLEPESRHSALLGLNMGVDMSRRAVAERACVTGQAALSGNILLQEEGGHSHEGCMMLLPIFRHGARIETEAERRAAIDGWVFARFITERLIRAVLGEEPPQLHLRILDAGIPPPVNLIFDEDPALTEQSRYRSPLFSTTIPITFGGRTWTLNFTTKPSFEAANRRGASLWAGSAGGVFSLLLFGIAWSLSHTRERALGMAADMTSTLRQTNDRLEAEIRERQRSQEALSLAKEAAEEASRTKSRFLASMSHELRTPLNSVIGFANILLKNPAGALGSSELNFLERIVANGKHLLTLINEILDLSKIEARKTEIQTSPVSLDVLIRETIAQQEGLVRDKPVQLVADLPARVASILTDADKLRQVLINLLGNALKFTEHGTVTVRLVTDANNRPIRLDVADTGIGIPNDKLAIIFEAFQQAEAGTARKYGGTGLGLTISQALCRLMGYRIEVASEVRRGSTFSVHLVTGTGAGTAAASAPAAASATAQRLPPRGVLMGKLEH